MTEVPSVALAKAQLRTQLLAARRDRQAGDLASARRAVADLALDLAVERGWQRVAAYEPLRTEPGSVDLLRRLVDTGVEVVVPVTLPDRDLDWVTWTSRTTSGIEAPGGVDAVFVPALAVGRDGGRLGRGGGSYDRALARCRPGTDLIALVFDDEVFGSVPVQAWDVAMHSVITPTGRWHLGQGNTDVASRG